MRFLPINRDAAALQLAHMPGNPKWDTSDGMASIKEIIGGGWPFLVTEETGEHLAVIVMDQNRHANGRELVIVVAHQLSRRGDLTDTMLPEILRVFGAGCTSVMVRTRRPGLVAKLGRAGFHEAAKIMRKKL